MLARNAPRISSPSREVKILLFPRYWGIVWPLSLSLSPLVKYTSAHRPTNTHNCNPGPPSHSRSRKQCKEAIIIARITIIGAHYNDARTLIERGCVCVCVCARGRIHIILGTRGGRARLLARVWLP